MCTGQSGMATIRDNGYVYDKPAKKKVNSDLRIRPVLWPQRWVHAYAAIHPAGKVSKQ